MQRAKLYPNGHIRLQKWEEPTEEGGVKTIFTLSDLHPWALLAASTILYRAALTEVDDAWAEIDAKTVEVINGITPLKKILKRFGFYEWW